MICGIKLNAKNNFFAEGDKHKKAFIERVSNERPLYRRAQEDFKYCVTANCTKVFLELFCEAVFSHLFINKISSAKRFFMRSLLKLKLLTKKFP